MIVLVAVDIDMRMIITVGYNDKPQTPVWHIYHIAARGDDRDSLELVESMGKEDRQIGDKIDQHACSVPKQLQCCLLLVLLASVGSLNLITVCKKICLGTRGYI